MSRDGQVPTASDDQVNASQPDTRSDKRRGSGADGDQERSERREALSSPAGFLPLSWWPELLTAL